METGLPMQVMAGVSLKLSDHLSEAEFMDSILDQIRARQLEVGSSNTQADWEAIEEEGIGDHYSQYPFLY